MSPNIWTVRTFLFVALTRINLLAADKYNLLPRFTKVNKFPAKQYFEDTITGIDIFMYQNIPDGASSCTPNEWKVWGRDAHITKILANKLGIT